MSLPCPTGGAQDSQDNLRLCLQNTFLHVKDVQEEASSPLLCWAAIVAWNPDAGAAKANFSEGQI